ncbi:MAG TPA: hypothetical protein VFX15_05275 [Actinomycetes bacterium]|nr:hypothetical protein [Actinomycetes bacterium]
MAESPASASIDQEFRALIASMPAVDELSDDVLRDRLVELERVVNAAHAAQAEVMTEIVARAGTAEYEFIADKLAITGVRLLSSLVTVPSKRPASVTRPVPGLIGASADERATGPSAPSSRYRRCYPQARARRGRD